MRTVKIPFLTRKTNSGFTLIELLVVIAIIALLAAILFPVFARARENARKSSCLNNMKQLGLGMLQYNQDFDEMFYWGLPVNTWPGIGWAGATYPYLKSAQIFRCPSDRGGGGNAAVGSTQLSYAFSTTVAQKNLADLVQSSRLVMMSETSVGYNVVYSNPQENGDYKSAADYGDNLVWGTNTLGGQCCGQILNGVYGAHRTGKYRDATAAVSNGNPANIGRHLDGGNFLLADGHVKWYKGDQVTWQGAQAATSQVSYCRPPLAVPANYCG